EPKIKKLRQPCAAGAGADGETRQGGLKRLSSLAGDEGPLRAEVHRQDAQVLGGIGARRTRTLRLAERDRLPVERGLHLGPHHVNREPEACDRVPVGVRADEPEVEARVAGCGGSNEDVLTTSTEQAAVDDRVVVADLTI